MGITRVGAFAALLAVGLAAFAAAALAGPAALPRGCATPPAFRPGAFGAVAYLAGASVHVIDLARGVDRAVATLPDRQPLPARLSWSPDGRWIDTGDLLVAAADGAICEPFGVGFTGLQWRPNSDDLLATGARGVVLGIAGGEPRVLLPPGYAVAAGAFAPSGDQVLAEGPAASLWVVDLATGARRRIWHSPSPTGAIGPPFPGHWSADGRWILFQTDPDRSASLAADGTPLWAVDAGGGRARMVEPYVLDSPDFVQPCARGIVVSAGLDRYVSAHKRIDLAVAPGWKPRTISDDPSHSWYAASCSPDGELVAATVTVDREETAFDTAQRSIWLLATHGSLRRLLVRPPQGTSDEEPRFARDGSWLLFFQHPARPYPVARLYLINVHTGRKLGPFGRIAGGLGYYGAHDWDGLAPWYEPR